MRVFILLSILGVALAGPRQINRIVGGEDTTIEQYPFMSNMQYNWFGIIWSQACGGALLTSRSILSAAHCYEGDRANQWSVLVGSSFPTSGTRLTVSQLIVHELYNRITLNNDVAIVRLATAAVFSNSVGVARIAGPNYNLADRTTVTAVGWGTLWSGGPTPNVLQHVDVNIINQDLCAERYAYLKSQPGNSNWPDITPGMLCAGIQDVGGKDACQGDSGGPLLHDRDVVVGVTSWGYGCAHDVYPGVNARVSFYADWIAANGSA